ncbi:sensor histidine kinase [Frondihabitans australicus]|uniref:sensor histidine kinase n=1 Tax=Frondihabitans australicus TaxID=386892 RepID=UPI0011C3904D|nr:histidine kinase [Frondihabitans australicus]
MTLLRLASIVVAPIVLTVAATHELAYNASPILQWVAVLAMVWSLVARRRAPVAVFAFGLAMVGVMAAVNVESVGDLAILVALYSVASHRDLRYSLACLAAVELGVVLVGMRIAPHGSVGDTVLVLSAMSAGAFFLGTTARAQRRYLASVEDRAERVEREREHLAELAAADERARIAREMHDIVAHGLSVVITLADGAAEITPAEAGPGREAMRQVAAAGRQSLAEMRSLLSVLRTDDVAEREPQPDLAALEALVDDVRATGLDVDLDQDAACSRLPSTVQATLYRIVQESTTNVLRHAPTAQRILIDLTVRGDTVRFSIAEFATEPARVVPAGAGSGSHSGGSGAGHATALGSGNGIRGMRERVALFGGELEAGPTVDGWLVRGYLRMAQP